MSTRKFPSVEIANLGGGNLFHKDEDCPYCHSHFVLKRGEQRRSCKLCERTWTVKSARKRQYFPKNKR